MSELNASALAVTLIAYANGKLYRYEGGLPGWEGLNELSITKSHVEDPFAEAVIIHIYNNGDVELMLEPSVIKVSALSLVIGMLDSLNNTAHAQARRCYPQGTRLNPPHFSLLSPGQGLGDLFRGIGDKDYALAYLSGIYLAKMPGGVTVHYDQPIETVDIV